MGLHQHSFGRQLGLGLTILWLAACGTSKKLEQANAELDRLRVDSVTQQARLAAVEQQLAAASADMARVQADADQYLADIEGCLLERESIEGNLMAMNNVIGKNGPALRKLAARADSALMKFAAAGIDVTYSRGLVHLSMPTYLLFNSGTLDLGWEGMEALSLIAGAINEMPEANVYVVGHADDDPVRAGWIDNWDLSAARAHAVTRALTDELGVDPGRVISGGRANFYPVADNATEEGRAMNRRVVIHVEPNLDRLWAIPKNED
jgi:chemotaxis protein MotB